MSYKRGQQGTVEALSRCTSANVPLLEFTLKKRGVDAACPPHPAEGRGEQALKYLEETAAASAPPPRQSAATRQSTTSAHRHAPVAGGAGDNSMKRRYI